MDNVVSDITGKTGMRIIRAMLDGERNPQELSKLRDPRCKEDSQTIAASLEGHYREEHLFSLRQAVELYDFYQKQILSCDEAIERQLHGLESKGDNNDPAPSGKRRKVKNALNFDVHSELRRITGVDLTKIDGMDENSVLKVLAETGTDMSAWPSEKHFAS